MVDFEYLYRGLCGLANAPRAGSMAGHLGAAVTAGYFLGEDHPELDPGVYAAIERDLNRITGGEESIWFDPKKAGITAEELFKPLPKEEGRSATVDKIAEALAVQHQQGPPIRTQHDLRLDRHSRPQRTRAALFAQARRGRGETDLPHSTTSTRAAATTARRRAGRTETRLRSRTHRRRPAYSSLGDMANVMIGQLIATASEHRRGFRRPVSPDQPRRRADRARSLRLRGSREKGNGRPPPALAASPRAAGSDG